MSRGAPDRDPPGGGGDAGRAIRPDSLEQAAEGLWTRLREVVLALARLESFNFTPERGAGPGGEGAVPELLADETRLARAVEELVRRAFRTALDEGHDRLLRLLVERDRVPLGELARLLDLPRLSLTERVNDLVQVGLATRILEEDAAAATPLASAVRAILGEIESRLLARVQERLPGLAGS